jgi:hypothetical protein
MLKPNGQMNQRHSESGDKITIDKTVYKARTIIAILEFFRITNKITTTTDKSNKSEVNI